MYNLMMASIVAETCR